MANRTSSPALLRLERAVAAPPDVIAARGAVTHVPVRGVALIFCLAASVTAGVAVARGYEVAILGLLAAALYACVCSFIIQRSRSSATSRHVPVDGFVLVQAGSVTIGQLWGAGLLLVLGVFLFGPTRTRGDIPLPIAALGALYAVFVVRGESSIAVQFGSKLALWLLLLVAVERIARTRSGQRVCFRAGYALAVGTALLIGVLIALNKYGDHHYQEFGAGHERGTEQSPIPLSFLALFSMPFPLVALLDALGTHGLHGARSRVYGRDHGLVREDRPSSR